MASDVAGVDNIFTDTFDRAMLGPISPHHFIGSIESIFFHRKGFDQIP